MSTAEASGARAGACAARSFGWASRQMTGRLRPRHPAGLQGSSAASFGRGQGRQGDWVAHAEVLSSAPVCCPDGFDAEHPVGSEVRGQVSRAVRSRQAPVV